MGPDIHELYRTDAGVDQATGKNNRNAHGFAIAVGRDPSGAYGFVVLGHDESAYAIVSREELAEIRDALIKELGPV